MRRSFDNLASSYIALERLLFWKKLDSARFGSLDALDLSYPQRALIVGDGDGRFSYQALKKCPHLNIDSIERSPRMREKAQTRIQQLGAAATNRHRYIADDARSYHYPFSDYDIVVAQFFLDCFHSSTANQLLSSFARTLKPKGTLIYSDFSIPERYPVKLIGQVLVSFLYLFFRLTTDIESKRLPILNWPSSLQRTSKIDLLGGLVTSEIRIRT